MTDINALAAWYEQQLDEDERLATAATPGPWWYNPAKQWLVGEAFERYDLTEGLEFVGYGGPDPFTGAVATTGPANHSQSMADAAYIAAHDPARVLRDIEAKKRLIGNHKTDEKGCCRTCAHWTSDWVDGIKVERLAYEGVHAPCLTLRLLALPYADRPGYLPEWRP